MAEQNQTPSVEPEQNSDGVSALAKIRERMNANGAQTNNSSQAEEVVPGLCINCKQAELENGTCPNCGYSKNQELYSGGL